MPLDTQKPPTIFQWSGGFVFYNRFEREFECDCYDLHGEPASQPALRQSRQYDWGISRPSPMLRKPKTSSISSNPNAFFPQQGHSAQGGSEFKSYGIITPTVKIYYVLYKNTFCNFTCQASDMRKLCIFYFSMLHANRCKTTHGLF